MPSEFKGTFRHAVDDKGRLAVPAKFRGELDGGCTVARWIDGCLAIFPPSKWEAIAAKVGSGARCSPRPTARSVARRSSLIAARRRHRSRTSFDENHGAGGASELRCS